MKIFSISLSVFMFFLSNLTFANQDTLLTEYKHTGDIYPPVFFVTNITDSSFKSAIEAFSSFEELDEKALGKLIEKALLKIK